MTDRTSLDGNPARSGAAATGPSERTAGISGAAATCLVFFASAAVLVVELVALRLLAPHLGLTLETNTLVIGIALAAIALGAWGGGRLADRLDPRRVLAPLLAISAVVVAATPFAVQMTATTRNPSLILVVAALTIMVPGTLLAAVTPMVTKLCLTSLEATGSVVGRLSGIGTAGSIVGTVVTGFVLISRVPVTGIMVGLGVSLLVAAALVALGPGRHARSGRRVVAATTAVALVGAAGAASVLVPDGCDVETTYHCAIVATDKKNPTGRYLVLDGLLHSYVRVDDPTHLEFGYTRSMASAIDAQFPSGTPVNAHHVGGGGLTMPRYLAATRPGTRSTVSEIDPGVIDIDRNRLGIETGEDLTVRIEDGRLGLNAVPAGSRDVVVGDAFGGISVPWHLTTREAAVSVHRALKPDGIYTLNVIDRGPLAFARAEVRTLREEFPHVAIASHPQVVAGTGGGNIIVLASDRPLDTNAWAAGMKQRGDDWTVLAGDDLRAWTNGAPVLTDDYAPVDQLLTVY